MTLAWVYRDDAHNLMWGRRTVLTVYCPGGVWCARFAVPVASANEYRRLRAKSLITAKDEAYRLWRSRLYRELEALNKLRQAVDLGGRPSGRAGW